MATNTYTRFNDRALCRLPGEYLQILHALGPNLNAGGECYVKLKTLADRIGLAISTVSRRIKRMTEDGILTVKNWAIGPGRRNHYCLDRSLMVTKPQATDERQAKLDLDEPAAASPKAERVCVQGANSNLHTGANSEEQRRSQRDSDSLSKTQKGVADDRKSSDSKIEIHPFGGKAALRRHKRVGPVVKANIERQWEMKLLRFLKATTPNAAAEFMDRLLELDVNDKAGRRALCNPIDARMRQVRWDDMREWKRTNLVAA